MKKTILITLVALGALALAGSAIAQIDNSHHDMAAMGYNSSISACEYCHTPHAANSGIDLSSRSPIWNRTLPAVSTFTPYGTMVSGTAASTVGTNSLTCLSCHDGVSAIDAVYNQAITGTTVIDTTPQHNRNIGQNLANDHPVGFTFENNFSGVPSAVFRTLNAGSIYGFRLYGSNTFECASCHDPHDDSTGNIAGDGIATPGGSDYFLRSPWASICSDCHRDK